MVKYLKINGKVSIESMLKCSIFSGNMKKNITFRWK